MEVLKVRRGESGWVLVAGELCGEFAHFCVLRVSPGRSLAAKRDGLLYAYRLLSPEEAEEARRLLERGSFAAKEVCAIVTVLLARGSEWGRRDMPVYRFAGTVVEVSPPRKPRRLFIKTDSPAVAEALKREFKARWLPRLRGWLVEASDWRSVVERVRVLAEGG